MKETFKEKITKLVQEEYADVLEIKEGRCGGAPTLIGTRLQPRDIVNFVSSYTQKEIQEEYNIPKEIVQRVLEFVQDALDLISMEFE